MQHMIADKVIFLHPLYDWQNCLLTFSSNSNALSHAVGGCSVERFSRSPIPLSRVGNTRGGFILPLAAALQGSSSFPNGFHGGWLEGSKVVGKEESRT